MVKGLTKHVQVSYEVIGLMSVTFATPAQVLFGEDLRLPGDMTPPLGSGETLEALLKRVKANVERPPAQTSLHKVLPVHLPPSTTTATHVYTDKPKKTPLGPIADGQFPIVRRLGKSCLEIQVGEYVNGKPRTEIRHWRTCHPAPPQENITPATRPPL